MFGPLIVELLITSESCALQLTPVCRFIKIYYIKQLNHNTDIIHEGWHLSLYIVNIQGSSIIIGPASFVVTASDIQPMHVHVGNALVKFADDTYIIVPAVNSLTHQC